MQGQGEQFDRRDWLEQQLYSSICSVSQSVGVCVLLRVICWNSHFQCHGVRRWNLWEVMRSWGWGPCEWDYCPYKKRPESFLSLPLSLPPSLPPTFSPSLSLSVSLPLLCKDTARRWPTRKQVLNGMESASIFITDFSASRTVRNKCLLFKASSLW